QRGKDSSHEEDERVQQGEDAEATSRLVEQIDRESRRDRASGGITRVRMHEGDVLVHVETSVLVGPGYRRSSRALLSNRSVKSSRSWVSASSCRRSWTPRSTSSSRAVTSADADCGRAARRRASLRTVYAGIPTNIRRAARKTAGSKWLSSSATPVIREDVASRLHDRGARESTLGVVPLRCRVGRGSGREPPGRGRILQHGPTPPPPAAQPLAVLPLNV